MWIMAGVMIAAERLYRIGAIHMAPISTSTIPRMGIGAGGSLNSSLLGLPEEGGEGVDGRREEEGEEP